MILCKVANDTKDTWRFAQASRFFISMKDYAKAFYKSSAWKHTRDAYNASVGGLCERCRAKGLIVPADIIHHKVYLTPENIADISVTLNWDNLEAVCRDCHAQEHLGSEKRFSVDALGRVTAK